MQVCKTSNIILKKRLIWSSLLTKQTDRIGKIKQACSTTREDGLGKQSIKQFQYGLIYVTQNLQQPNIYFNIGPFSCIKIVLTLGWGLKPYYLSFIVKLIGFISYFTKNLYWLVKYRPVHRKLKSTLFRTSRVWAARSVRVSGIEFHRLSINCNKRSLRARCCWNRVFIRGSITSEQTQPSANPPCTLSSVTTTQVYDLIINRGVPKNVYVIQYSPDLHYDKIERVSHGNGMNRLSSNFAGIGLSLSRCSILDRGASWIFLSYIGITLLTAKGGLGTAPSSLGLF